jgi:hypothetical protein
MNKDKRRRNKRRNRDLRWLARVEAGTLGKYDPTGRHRRSKVYGESRCLGWDDNGKEIITSTAFWCKETDKIPAFALRYSAAGVMSALLDTPKETGR